LLAPDAHAVGLLRVEDNGRAVLDSPLQSRFILSKRTCSIKVSYALQSSRTLSPRTRALL
jgi:hypothetical protein